MSRGRQIILPSSKPAPARYRKAGDPLRWIDEPVEALIDAAVMGALRDVRVRAYWQDVNALVGTSYKTDRRAWTDGANHPKDTTRRDKRGKRAGRPADPNLRLLVQAIERLRDERAWKLYHSRRFAIDRMVALVGLERFRKAWQIPQHVADAGATEAQQYRDCRVWLMERLIA